jgi:undecaprenyl-diphosphatase
VPFILKIFILAVVQGLCELLPVSSSAHVIIAEKLMGLDPTTPLMTFVLVMLHTGTMLAVIAYFWSSWRSRFFSSAGAFGSFARNLILATACTGVVGFGLILVIERVILHGAAKAEVEQLFGNMNLIAIALASVGVMIILSGRRAAAANQRQSIVSADAAWIGVVQGLCLPFRGFSRSGATISTGLFRGLQKELLENFSFALAVILTPPVIAREGYRLLSHTPGVGLAAGAGFAPGAGPAGAGFGLVWPSLVGMTFSFVAGWYSLKWLSRWLEQGRWHLFGYYCLVAAAAVFVIGITSAHPAAAEYRAANLTITEPWSRPTPPGATVGAAYFSITNAGRTADRLIGLSSPVARTVEIHESRVVQGIMQMRAATFAECPPGATVKIEPGGLHVMLVGLLHPLEVGTEFPLTLRFRDAGVLTLQVPVSAQ